MKTRDSTDTLKEGDNKLLPEQTDIEPVHYDIQGVVEVLQTERPAAVVALEDDLIVHKITAENV